MILSGTLVLAVVGAGSASPFCDAQRLAEIDGDRLSIHEVAPASDLSFVPEGRPPAGSDLPAFCRVRATTRSGEDSLIQFEVWVPTREKWNGKLVGTGNGGYSPTLGYRDMAFALRRGYAVVGGDTGHQTQDPNDLGFGVGHPAKIADWGSRSIHAITVAAKEIVKALVGRPIERAYYYGCSTGGHQGLTEVQRYPNDYDGVVAGAPGNNRVRLNVEFLWRFLANHAAGDDAHPILTREKMQIVAKAAVAACDRIDGLTDGVIDDPRQCTPDRFDLDKLQCVGEERPGCLTAPQVAAVRKMYAGPRNPRTGEQLFPGLPRGSEAGWAFYWGTTEPARADFWRQWVFEDAGFDWWSFDFDRDVARADREVGGLIDAIDPEIGAFARRDGKLIVYHGWADAGVSAQDSIDYYEKVKAAQGAQERTDRFYRLFLVSGMGHCGGGPGGLTFGNAGIEPPVVDAGHDLLSALDHWVETGEAPDQLIGSVVADGKVRETRLLCAYPRRAAYRPDRNDQLSAEDFVCE